MGRPTIFQIKEAIVKNVCAPDEGELEELATSKLIRTSTKREGDAELGMILLIGIATAFGYSFNEINLIAPVELEYELKLQKFRVRVKNERSRFFNKVRLVLNYLKLKYGISAVLPIGRR